MEKQINIPDTVMATIPLTSIQKGERFRKDYGDLTDLKFSIQSQGLINPLAVMQTGDSYILVAGGRRLQALEELGVSEVPVRIFEKFDELTLRLLELAENLQRKDMTWQEQNSLQREIHRLQQQIHGPASTHTASGWKLEDTAQMLGVSKSSISDSIILGEKLDRYKSVLGDASKFKTENEARKAVRMVEEAMIRTELAKRAERQQSSNNFVQDMANRYQIGDCITMLAKSPEGVFDFAEVDPPYGINLGDVKRNNDCEGYTEIEQQEYLVFTKSILQAVYRVLKPSAFCVYWFGIDPWFEYIYQIAKEVGFYGLRIPLIWIKPNGQSLNPSANLATAYEPAFIFKKGSPILAKPGRLNVFQYTPLMAGKKFHPTQKPLDLYQDIYETFSFEGANCVVPFAGSGASIVAAAMSKRNAIGWDLNQEYKGGYVQLVQETFLQGQKE